MKKKFLPAFTGLFEARKDTGVQIQIFLGFLAVLAGFILKINPGEWLAVLIMIALVVSLEIINACLEKLCDLYTTEYNEKIRVIKDLSAGAVLWSACVALVIGGIIFLPKIWRWIK